MDAQVGYLTSAYPLGMFGALFFWPKLSDLVGRRVVLCTCLAGVGAGFVMQVRRRVRDERSLAVLLFESVRYQRCGG